MGYFYMKRSLTSKKIKTVQLFTKVVPSIFYADIQIALKTFIDCLEFTISHDELHTNNPFCVVDKDGLSIMLFQNVAYAEKGHQEIRLVTNLIHLVYERVVSKFPELLHPDLKDVTVSAWGTREFTILDGQIGIKVQQLTNWVKDKKEYILPYFEPIDIANLKEHYFTKFAFPDHNYLISLDLNFKNKQLDQAEADDIAKFLSVLEDLDKQNHLAIEKDFVDQVGETFGYIQFYLDELDNKELKKIIGKNKDNTPIEKRLLQKLRLVRVGLYPDDDNGSFAIFDYSIDIDREPCNQVLVIKTGKDGIPLEIDWES